jgi:uracil-DNA glycosylase
MSLNISMELKNTDWSRVLRDEFEKPYYRNLMEFIRNEYETKTIYPEKQDIFNAFQFTSYKDVRVVLLGQDPYHGPNQAHGLSFSVKPDVKLPPSLRNIFKELHQDLGFQVPNNGYLVKWARQGVMLLNTVLTVREGEAHSHKNKGWETFTNEVIKQINKKESPVIFMLWGRPAQTKINLIDTDKHYVIESAHPSPLSANRGFFGSRPFSKVNEILENYGLDVICWKIESC